MNTSPALKMFKNYQKSNFRPNTAISYRYLLDNFDELFGDRDLASISSEEIFQFFEILTEHNAKATKRHRYSHLKAFFNFIIMNYEPELRNPVDTPLMRKAFRLAKPKPREIIPKEIMDEVIFNIQNNIELSTTICNV